MLRRRFVATALLGIFLFDPISLPAVSLPYAFKQIVVGKNKIVLFYDARWDRAFVEDHVVQEGASPRAFSNIDVVAYPPREDFPGHIDSVREVKTWIDPRGHVHSLAALAEQMRFDHWLMKHRPPCASTGCTLSVRRDAPLTIKTVPLTGITDIQTLRLRQWELESRYDTAAATLDEYCKTFAMSDCGDTTDSPPLVRRWSDGLVKARSLLDAYDVVLSSVPTRSPRAPNWMRSHSYDVPEGRFGGGLENLEVGGSKKYEDLDGHVGYDIAATGDEPELGVQAAVDLKALVGMKDQLETTRRRAAKAVEDVEFVADWATTVPEPEQAP